MSITSRIMKPWLSWVGLVCLVLVGIGLVGAIIFPMFAKSRSRWDRMASEPVRKMMMPAPLQMRAPSMTVAKTTTPSIIGTAWAASPQRMMIYTADVSLETGAVEMAHREITDIARRAGGFVTGSGIENSDGRLSANVTVRVPQKEYASTLDAICKLAKVLNRTEKGEDVTEEFVDLESRLRNLKREEEAFLTVLGKASRIPDILAVERELSRVRGEIETAEGRLKFLANRIELSTITVSLEEPQPVVTRIVKWDVRNTGKAAANSLSGVFRGIMSLVIWAVVFIPFWLLVWLVVWLVVWIVKGRMRRRGRAARPD